MKPQVLCLLLFPGCLPIATLACADENSVRHTPFGLRLVQAAVAGTDEKPVKGSGPIYESMQVEGNKIRLRFKHTDGGLKAKGIANPETILPLSHWAYLALERVHQNGFIEALPQNADGSSRPLSRHEIAVRVKFLLNKVSQEKLSKPRGLVSDTGPTGVGGPREDSIILSPEAFNDVLIATQREFSSELEALGMYAKILDPNRREIKPVLHGFAIAGEDRKWVWADALIDGDTVVVYSHLVPNPVAVRYAWTDNPAGNLYNGADLPASPFRTDDWPSTLTGEAR